MKNEFETFAADGVVTESPGPRYFGAAAARIRSALEPIRLNRKQRRAVAAARRSRKVSR